MAEELGERTELPTGRRRAEARQEGRVAKSPDLAASVDLIGAAIVIAVFGGFGVAGLGVLLRRMLQDQTPGSALDVDSIRPMLLQGAIAGAWVVGPALGILLIVACISQYLQVGWFITSRPLVPKLDRLNPAAGLGKFVNVRNLVRTGANLLKLSVISAVAGIIIRSQLPEIVALPNLPMAAAIYKALLLALNLAIWLLVLLLIMGIADYLYQRWQHTQDLRMTKQEVKDERRSLDGDPDIKARRFRMARDIALQRLQQAVPKADVIVTNPTHFSVALQYDQDKMKAPRVIAKGADEMAFRIRQLALATGVPLVERPPLARGLYWTAKVGQEIRPEYYEAVAEVLAYVYRLKEKAA